MSIKPVEQMKIPEVEGSIDLIYGGLGGGKTYVATAEILKDLYRGVPVFATWPIKFDGLDESKSFLSLFLGVFGLKRRYRIIDKSNFHYVPLERLMDDSFIDEIESLVDCVLYVDEGYAARLFDSYRKTNMGTRQRMAVYGTRHFNRRIVIVAQRPNAIHVSSRSMVNRFFKCEQPFPFLYRLLHVRFFIKTEFQDMIDETVDEEKPLRTKFFFGSPRVYKAYDSKYLRAGRLQLYPSKMTAVDISYFSRVQLLLSGFKRPQARFSEAGGIPTPPTTSRSIRKLKINKLSS